MAGYNLHYAYIKQLLAEERRPMSADEIAGRMEWTPDDTRYVVDLAVEHGRLTVVDGRYDLADAER